MDGQAGSGIRTALAGTVAVLVGVQLYPLLVWTPAALVTRNFLVDDAFFYSVLARNFWRLGFLTFDGTMPTNGVQPLWMWTQIALARLFPAVDGVTLLARSTWAVYVAFSFLTVWFVARGTTATAVIRTVLVAGLVLLNHAFQIIVVQGLETSLFLLMVVATLVLCDTWLDVAPGEPRRPLSTRQVVVLAGAASLCFLARTDFFWMFVLIALWNAMRAERPPHALRTFVLVGVALIGPYLAHNLRAHGGLMPISGRVKLFYLGLFSPDLASYLAAGEWEALFHALPSLIRLGPTVALATRVEVALVLLAAGFAAAWRLRRANQLPDSLELLTWAVVGHIVLMQLAYRELRDYSAYYFAAEMWWLAVVAAMWISSGRRYKFAALAAGVLACVVGFEWETRTFEPSTYWIERINLAEDIGRLPSAAKVGAFWPGCFAAFSGREIAPLDGIIGSNDYFQNYIKPGREFDYIRERHIEYIAIYLTSTPDVILGQRGAPRLLHWSDLGIQRLWEHRDLPIEVVSKRTFSGNVGWYLLRVGGS